MESIEASILSSWGMENKDVALLLARIITIRLNLLPPFALYPKLEFEAWTDPADQTFREVERPILK